MLIGLMSLQNQVVYVQFHPVACMVKLNIEMSMANLIKKLAKDSVDDRNHRIESVNHVYTMNDHTHSSNQTAIKMKSGNHTSASVAKLGKSSTANIDDSFDGIRATTEVLVRWKMSHLLTVIVLARLASTMDSIDAIKGQHQLPRGNERAMMSFHYRHRNCRRRNTSLIAGKGSPRDAVLFAYFFL